MHQTDKLLTGILLRTTALRIVKYAQMYERAYISRAAHMARINWEGKNGKSQRAAKKDT